ncbi:AAA family ATPase [Flavisolibacter ginsengisoli]|jgi:MoxR-like ATPase|uniref:MoxR-like ATPase n=1 Tax=Flavisolibacter ginsengisoli DSM 18119 TaxID=1121884 RepID=A0A1M5BDY6_9BACT|nr:MoxR family ATPase [Flavisolibacter ginsengisoli]SHF40620.1 MoxR-like ATPase [Flavisolibacter ginsengisoli DSM 18119]
MEEPIFEIRTDLSELNDAVNAVRQQIKKIIVGQDDMVRLIITALLADGHVLIEGVPGVAKTLTAKLVAKCLAVQFSRIQFTPDLMPSDVLGTPVFNPTNGTFEFKKGPLFSNIVLIDEINRAPAKTQAALFEVMEEKQITVDGRTYPMAVPFMVLATQNPIEQEGTYRLPEAQLDRFLFKVLVPYPSESEEMEILTQFHQMGNTNVLSTIEPVLKAEQLVSLRKQVKNIVIEEKLLQFIAKLVHQTRNHKSIYLGGSPRASLAIMNASKAYAAINGRDFVTPEDILEVVPPVLRHRIILSPDKEMEGVSEDAVLRQIIQTMEIPR